MAQGPWGIHWLRPQALFGLNGIDPLVNVVFWSLLLNTATLVIVSLLTTPSALERVQAAVFADLFRPRAADAPAVIRGSATFDDLYFVAERVLGADRARSLFDGMSGEPTAQFIDRLERELAGSIGVASAHVMLSKVISGGAVSMEEVFEMAGETRQAIAYSQQLERTSSELRSTAAQLENANRLLRELHSQKDEFLSQVSHEVRTPMASIRSFAEILLDEQHLQTTERRRFVTTIHQESLRLTKLLDEILDLSALERGERPWENTTIQADAALDRAIEVCSALARQRKMQLIVGKRAEAVIDGDADRLSQVLINLISNAIKYNDAADPVIEVRSRVSRGNYVVEVADNGAGIPREERTLIFEKFARGTHGAASTPGAGLGLAISRQIISRMNGKLELVSNKGTGACFRVTLPLSRQQVDA
jgi:signal transduction histidine kinase